MLTVANLEMELVHVLAVVVGVHNTVDLLSGSHDIGQRSIMVHEVDQGSNELTHVCFNKVRSCIDFGRQIGKIRSDDLIKIAMLVSSIEILQTIGEQTKGTADIYASGIHCL